MSKKKKAFIIEDLRASLASENNLQQLEKLYSKKYPEIRDENTGRLWDHLNLENKPSIIKNPMERDRLNEVAGLVVGEKINVLNIGFGSANLEEKFFSRSHSKDVRWQGIDISSRSVKNAQKRFPEAYFEIGDISKLKFKKNYFDYAISLEVLEHIKPSEIIRALEQVIKIIKPGGYYIISVPLNEGLEEMISRGENPNAHIRVYTPELIKAEMRIAGFNIVKDKTLFAFHNFYKLKTLLAKYIFHNRFKSNNLLVVAQKPL